MENNPNHYRFFSFALILLLAIQFYGCYPNYGKTQSYTSPDSRFIIDVTNEDQLSNDPDPFWYHVSLRDSSLSTPILPGNFLVIPAYNRPVVSWKNSDTVLIEFTDRFGQSFDEASIKSRYWNEIYIQISVQEESNK